MHDDRALVEGRIERVLRERVRPAVHGARVPVAIEVWHAPGEPVPCAEAASQVKPTSMANRRVSPSRWRGSQKAVTPTARPDALSICA